MYRLDLESFLYIFLWPIISNRSEGPPSTSAPSKWSRRSFSEIAARKALDMENDNFGRIVEEFETDFHSLKPLAAALRAMLFPSGSGITDNGTDDSLEAVSELYSSMIGAFEDAMASENRQTK